MTECPGSPAWEIRCGHVLDVLRAMADESVHCVVTSPPYWGLRAYKTEPQVWSGEPDCAHEWGPMQRGKRSDLLPADQTTSNGRLGTYDVSNEGALNGGHFCARCGAWRGELGSEPTIELYVEHIVSVFREIRRVLRNDGTCWLNIGDSYAGSGKGPTGQNGLGDQGERQGFTRSPARFATSTLLGAQSTNLAQPGYSVSSPGLKSKDLCLIPFRLALALQADGFWVRSDIAWCKTAPMPESVRDRPTSAWEHILLLSKSRSYFWDAEAVRTPATVSSSGGANLRNYWVLPPEPFTEWGETVRRVPVPLDAVDGDTKRITASDCPVHGYRIEPDPTPSNDGRGTDHDSYRSPGTPGPELVLPPSLFATVPTPELGSADGNLDSPHPLYSPAATDRNSESHRTDLAPATSPAYSASAQTSDHTGDTSESRETSDSDGRTAESSILADALPDEPRFDPSGQTQHNNTDRCTCSYYREYTERVSHFAVFPTEIARRAILAGTSERGCCPRCGAPWRRVMERSVRYASGSGRAGKPPNGKYQDSEQATSGDYDIRMGPQVYMQTLGWEPGCTCDAGEPVPCVVLDPFVGSGTTLMVALRHGRRAIGIELNPEYCAMARKRIVADAPLFNGPVPYEPAGEALPDKQGALGKRTYSGFNAR